MRKYLGLIVLLLSQLAMADVQIDTTDGNSVMVPGYVNNITNPLSNPMVQTSDGKITQVPGIPLDIKFSIVPPYNMFQMDIYQGDLFLLPPVQIISPVNAINYNWGSASMPSGNLTNNIFSVRYSGDFTFATTGNYTFSMTVDDGGRLFLDTRKIIDSWKSQAATTYTVTIAVQAGVHRIVHDYENLGGKAVDIVSWMQGNTIPKPVIPGISPTPKPTGTVPVPVTQIVLTTTSGGSITDGSKNVWTLTTAGVVMENGVAAAGGSGTSALTFVASTATIWAQDGTSKNWYSWNGTTWVGPTATSPVGLMLNHRPIHGMRGMDLMQERNKLSHDLHACKEKLDTLLKR